jgi:hypothetical protein
MDPFPHRICKQFSEVPRQLISGLHSYFLKQRAFMHQIEWRGLLQLKNSLPSHALSQSSSFSPNHL